MRYMCEVDINSSLDKVVALFDDPSNLKHWQPGLVSWELISGERGQPGAKARLQLKMGDQTVEMIETVTVRNLPKEFAGVYKGNGVTNKVRNGFVAMGPNKTRMIVEQEFEFSGFMKLMSKVLPGVFKKTTQNYLDLFKAFVEGRA